MVKDMNDDLRDIAGAAGPFATVALPAPSHHPDAAHRYEVNWKNARAALAHHWSAEVLDDLDGEIAALPHGGGAALVIIQSSDGRHHLEFIDEPVHGLTVVESGLPRLALLIEARQRAIAHVVVETDRAGADLTAFDGGDVVEVDVVEGETEFIHRGHPGGWSQRRYQQRAENTWEHNAGDVAHAVVAMVDRVGAVKVFVSGEVRAQSLVLEALRPKLGDKVVELESGSPDGIAEEVVRLLSSHVASGITELAERVRERVGTGTASVDTDEVLRAIGDGRVEHLLVHDNGGDEPTIAEPFEDIPAGTRVVDVAVVAALRSNAKVTVVPQLAIMNGPLAALMRW